MKNQGKAEIFKAVIIALLVSASIFLTIWFHQGREEELIFPSVYYLPIILACLWWDRKGIWLAVFFSLLLIISSVVSPTGTATWELAIRASAFMLTAVVVAELSLRRKRLIGTLEEKVRERTKELQARNEELDAFAHTVSHDLIGPLGTLEGFAVVARDAFLEGDADLEEEGLNTVLKLARRMIYIVQTLLEYARAGRPQGEVERVAPRETIQEMFLELKKGIVEEEVEVLVEEDLPDILLDPLKLKQVLSNLVGNSVKHSGAERDLKIEIGSSVQGGTATLFVRDNGLGMDVDELDTVFEPFTRLGGGQTYGLGLGLAIVKRAVEAWGGKIWVQSAPGEGTTFFFTAPLADQGIGTEG
jgi:signal transduction histidine kinase